MCPYLFKKLYGMYLYSAFLFFQYKYLSSSIHNHFCPVSGATAIQKRITMFHCFIFGIANVHLDEQNISVYWSARQYNWKCMPRMHVIKRWAPEVRDEEAKHWWNESKSEISKKIPAYDNWECLSFCWSWPFYQIINTNLKIPLNVRRLQSCLFFCSFLSYFLLQGEDFVNV